ncbi:MAG: YggS family pyridoxal phosphate-dependent enzyme [Chitinophagaceae bacterium]|nr:YggS family pyridoxal phosphate-dependent enzyme [Chitinophagaceae bacterium]MCW5904854.1 YggS family pyridoxal phosphate-dependent enzyme [Chitinophagaceae bacterium]
MSVNKEAYLHIINELKGKATLVAVSKIKPVEDILALYELGQKDFGENYVQELVDKQAQLPTDIYWHFIGHLQSNKVKYIAPFVHLIHGVDSLKLLQEINKQAAKHNRTIQCLLQVHIAQETTKFGFSFEELEALLIPKELNNVEVVGLMGMASFSDDKQLVRNEFMQLKNQFEKLSSTHSSFKILSMGMSDDYSIALEEGSNMLRIGSLLFGKRIYTT